MCDATEAAFDTHDPNASHYIGGREFQLAADVFRVHGAALEYGRCVVVHDHHGQVHLDGEAGPQLVLDALGEGHHRVAQGEQAPGTG